MNTWKVILATLVIYSAGLITGGLLVRQGAPFRHMQPSGPPPNQGIPLILQQRFLERMKVELALTREQAERLDRLFAESRERTRIIMDLVRPEVQSEVRALRERILAELTPTQRRQFETMRERGPRDPFGPNRWRDPRRELGGPQNRPELPSERR